MAPRLSIRVVILILPSDTLFGHDLYCFDSDHPKREMAMLSNQNLIKITLLMTLLLIIRVIIKALNRYPKIDLIR